MSWADLVDAITARGHSEADQYGYIRELLVMMGHPHRRIEIDQPGEGCRRRTDVRVRMVDEVDGPFIGIVWEAKKDDLVVRRPDDLMEESRTKYGYLGARWRVLSDQETVILLDTQTGACTRQPWSVLRQESIGREFFRGLLVGNVDEWLHSPHRAPLDGNSLEVFRAGLKKLHLYIAARIRFGTELENLDLACSIIERALGARILQDLDPVLILGGVEAFLQCHRRGTFNVWTQGYEEILTKSFGSPDPGFSALLRDHTRANDAFGWSIMWLARWDFQTCPNDEVLDAAYTALSSNRRDTGQQEGEYPTTPIASAWAAAHVHWDPNRTLLDVACGSGRLLADVVVSGINTWRTALRTMQSFPWRNIYAVDLNPRALGITRMRLVLQLRPRLGNSIADAIEAVRKMHFECADSQRTDNNDVNDIVSGVEDVALGCIHPLVARQWPRQFDVVLVDAPAGRRGPTRWTRFTERVLDWVSPTGTMALCSPRSIFSSRESKRVRQRIRHDFHMVRLFDMEMLGQDGIPMVVTILGRGSNAQPIEVWYNNIQRHHQHHDHGPSDGPFTFDVSHRAERILEELLRHPRLGSAGQLVSKCRVQQHTARGTRGITHYIRGVHKHFSVFSSEGVLDAPARHNFVAFIPNERYCNFQLHLYMQSSIAQFYAMMVLRVGDLQNGVSTWNLGKMAHFPIPVETQGRIEWELANRIQTNVTLTREQKRQLQIQFDRAVGEVMGLTQDDVGYIQHEMLTVPYLKWAWGDEHLAEEVEPASEDVTVHAASDMGASAV